MTLKCVVPRTVLQRHLNTYLFVLLSDVYSAILQYKTKTERLLKRANLSTLLSLGYSARSLFTASSLTVAYFFWPEAERGSMQFDGKRKHKWRFICQ